MRSGVFLKTAALSILLIASRNFVFALEENQNTFKVITEAAQSIEQNLLEESVMLEIHETDTRIVSEELNAPEIVESSTKALTEEILGKQVSEAVDPVLLNQDLAPVIIVAEVTDSHAPVVVEKPILNKQLVRNQQLVKSGAGSNNMDSFEGATTVRCEQGNSCQSCTSKKRAHSGISGVTFAITIAAIIGAALIISSAGTAATPSP